MKIVMMTFMIQINKQIDKKAIVPLTKERKKGKKNNNNNNNRNNINNITNPKPKSRREITKERITFFLLFALLSIRSCFPCTLSHCFVGIMTLRSSKQIVYLFGIGSRHASSGHGIWGIGNPCVTSDLGLFLPLFRKLIFILDYAVISLLHLYGKAAFIRLFCVCFVHVCGFFVCLFVCQHVQIER